MEGQQTRGSPGTIRGSHILLIWNRVVEMIRRGGGEGWQEGGWEGGIVVCKPG